MLKNWLQRSSLSFSRQQQLSYHSLWRRSLCCSSALTNNDHHTSLSRAHRFTSNKKSAQHLSSYYDAIKRASFATTTAADSDDAPLRRRRRKPSSRSPNSNDESTSSNTSSSSNSSSSSEAFFSPIDAQTGQLLTSDQYLELASLSPWVPCPDVVSKRVFEIASASEQDVHVDLGCGDGRLNFMAVDGNTRVGKSWGLDVDENILKKCHERLGRRFVPSKKKHDDDEEESMLEFVQADLVEVIELQKKLYQQQQLQQEPTLQQLLEENEVIETSNNNNINDDTNKSSLQSITNKIANSTIITMYFVDNALKQVQPYLSSVLGGKQNVRVITIGYEMPKKDGWDASWVERVLGLTIFRYDMEGVSKFPLDWSLENENDEEGEDESGHDILNLTDENDQDVEEFLRRKRQEDMEELNRGLRIHHDEELDEFAHARAKKQGLSAQHSGSSSTTLSMEEEDGGDEWDDFDETEEPEELMKEAQRRMMEERKASRGKMMAGVGGGERKKSSPTAAKKKPTWKKP
jgi:hypothetical protein